MDALQHLKAAQTIAAKAEAENRDFTPDELKAAAGHLEEHKRLKAAEKAGADGKNFKMTFAELEALMGPAAGIPGIGKKDAWAKEVATRLTKTVGEFGVKAITTGGIDIPQVVESVVTTPAEPARVLDLLVSRKPLTGNTFEYLQQTARTSAAGPVADGATKPTSTYTFEDEEGRARVFAHLTEAFPQRYLADHEEIRSILASQMAEDLYLALEEDVLVGDGTGEHFTGLANVSGVRAQAYTTDVMTTLRKARTTLTGFGEAPNAWVLNPSDLESIDLIREDGATGGFMDGIDAKVFGNLPKVASSVVPAGTAYLGDWRQARLYVREGGRLDADTSGTLFETNQIKLRYEGRFGFAVLRPGAFIEIDLTAA